MIDLSLLDEVIVAAALREEKHLFAPD